MKTHDLIELIEKDEYKTLEEWLLKGGDPNSVIHKKSLLEASFAAKSDNCSYVLLLYGASNAESTNPRFARMLQEIRDSHKLMRDLPLSVLSKMDDLSIGTVGNTILNEPRNIMSSEVNGAKVLHVGLHQFEHRNPDFINNTLREVFSSPEQVGKFACVVSLISKRHLLNQDQFQERITGFLIFREVPAEVVGQVTMGIKMIEQETLIGILYSEEPILNWKEDEKQYDISSMVRENIDLHLKKHEKKKSFKMQRRLSDINSWSHEINEMSQKFMKRFGVYPQIILASGETFDRFDLVANTNSQENITNDSGKNPREFVKMTGFNGPGYNLQFCVDDRFELDTIQLIYPR